MRPQLRQRPWSLPGKLADKRKSECFFVYGTPSAQRANGAASDGGTPTSLHCQAKRSRKGAVASGGAHPAGRVFAAHTAASRGKTIGIEVGLRQASFWSHNGTVSQ